MFPDANVEPSGFRQALPSVRVPLDVALDLRSPEFPIGPRNRLVLLAAVPEAPVNEDRDSRRAEHDVGGAPDRRQRPGVDPVSKSGRVKPTPQLQLDSRVATALPAHAVADALIEWNGDRPVGRARHHFIVHHSH